MRKEHKQRIRIISWILFGIYLIMMVYFLFFSEQMGRVCRQSGDSTGAAKPARQYHMFHSIWICYTGTVCAMQQFWQDPSAKFFGIITGREYTISVQVRIV